MPEEQAQQARTRQKLNRCSILDEYRDQIEKIFYDTEGNCVNVQEVFAKLHPEMQPSLRLIQWYCQKEGFRSCLRHTRATKHTRSIETPPGFEVQIDFGEKTVSVNSEPTTIHFFTACQASFKLPPPKKIKSTTSTHDTIVNLSGKVSLRLPWKKVIALDKRHIGYKFRSRGLCFEVALQQIGGRTIISQKAVTPTRKALLFSSDSRI